jgi:hypothetical protein
MELDEAEEVLAEAELVACAQAPLLDAKELRDACLAAEIPVLLDRGDCCGKGGCGCAPKLALLAREEDVPRIAHLMQERWRALALREGTVDLDHPSVAPTAVGDAACPACGTSAARVEGACAECGLQLE